MPLTNLTFDESSKYPGIGVNCQALFYLLGEQKIRDIFTSPFREVLDHCETKVPSAVPDFIDAVKSAPIQTSLQQLLTLFERTTNVDPYDPMSKTWADTTLEDLVRGNVTPDIQVQGASQALKELGGFLPFYHIPAGMHYHAISLIDDYEFLAPGNSGFGNKKLKVFLEETGHKQKARKAKLAGIFRVLANPFLGGEHVKGGPFGEGNGRCCSGGSCTAVTGPYNPDDYYCESTDPEDPSVNDCNSLSDTCP